MNNVIHTPYVRFVDDFRLDELLDDILECDKSDGFIEWVTLPFVIHPVHERHVPLDACKSWMT